MVTLDDVRAAAVRIRGVAVRTPLLEVGPLALKCENLQPMGAFKVRGACNMIAQLPPAARAAGVITYSSGNHGQAMALVAQRFGMPAVRCHAGDRPGDQGGGRPQVRSRSPLRRHDDAPSEGSCGRGA
jgi:threonine dehydratase